MKRRAAEDGFLSGPYGDRSVEMADLSGNGRGRAILMVRGLPLSRPDEMGHEAPSGDDLSMGRPSRVPQEVPSGYDVKITGRLGMASQDVPNDHGLLRLRQGTVSQRARS